MNNVKNEKVTYAFLISLFSMLIPMILATRVLGSTSYLAPLYAIGFLVQCFSMIFAISSPKIRIKRKMLRLVIIYFLILLLPFLNNWISNIKTNYFDPINAIVKLVCFFMFYVAIHSIEVEEDAIYKFFRVIVRLSLVICLYSLIFEFNDILSIRYISNTNALAIRSAFSNRNQYSAFLVIAFVANLYLNQIRKFKYRYLTYAMQIFCILTTFSRAAFFSVFIIVCMLFLQMKNYKKKIIVAIMLAIIVLGALLTTGAFDYISNNYVRLEASGDSGRFKLWEYAWGVAKDNLFTGVGFYTGADIAISRGMWLSQFHSMFFDLLVDGGILEIIFILFILYSVCKNCSQKCPDKRLVYVYRASLVAFLFHASVESLSIFALSYSDSLYTIFIVSLPILLANMQRGTRKKM